MSTKFGPEKHAIAMHLSDIPASKGMKMFSGFVQGLKESRQATGRLTDTGEKISGVSHASWLGTIGYMSLLDQIGTCFKPKLSISENGNSIRKSLKYFSSLNDTEIDAIYALRCAFAHDFSLYNINPRKPSLTHCFKVNGNDRDPVVTLPKSNWDGDYQKKNSLNHTLINLEALGDLVELICTKLFNDANTDQLEVVLPSGSDELLQRYSYFSLKNN